MPELRRVTITVEVMTDLDIADLEHGLYIETLPTAQRHDAIQPSEDTFNEQIELDPENEPSAGYVLTVKATEDQ